MTEYANSYSKDAQLSRSPGNKKASAKEKGEAMEKKVAKAFNGRKNHQGKPGGGLSVPDVSAMQRWQLEVKDTERLNVPVWLRTLVAETPPSKKPGLVFTVDKEPWLTIRLADKESFAADLVEQAGFDVVPR